MRIHDNHGCIPAQSALEESLPLKTLENIFNRHLAAFTSTCEQWHECCYQIFALQLLSHSSLPPWTVREWEAQSEICQKNLVKTNTLWYQELEKTIKYLVQVLWIFSFATRTLLGRKQSFPQRRRNSTADSYRTDILGTVYEFCVRGIEPCAEQQIDTLSYLATSSIWWTGWWDVPWI